MEGVLFPNLKTPLHESNDLYDGHIHHSHCINVYGLGNIQGREGQEGLLDIILLSLSPCTLPSWRSMVWMEELGRRGLCFMVDILFPNSKTSHHVPNDYDDGGHYSH